MSDKEPLSEEDIDLFRRAVGEVKPVKQGQRPPDPGKAPPVPVKRVEDDRAVMSDLKSGHLDPDELETGEELSFLRPGVKRSVLRQLRRGQFVVQSELDLHGMNTETARIALRDFLADCRTRGLRCARIVHGKGRRSSNRGPVLKPLLNRLLQQRDDVLAFSSARPVDGGTGALYVLLKKSR
jgi:DNA-nicking Smr family endonuclease